MPAHRSLGILCLGLSLGVLAAAEEDPDASATAVVELKDHADLNELLSAHRIVMVEFYKPWCGYCKRLQPEYERAAKELRALGSSVRLAATQAEPLLDDFEAKLIPCLMVFDRGQLQYRHWGWDRDDVFDFMRTFDTMVLPVGSVFRSYYWLRSLYKFGIGALLKTLQVDKQHPLQVWLPQLLAPLILLALMVLLLLLRCFLSCCRRCSKKAANGGADQARRKKTS